MRPKAFGKSTGCVAIYKYFYGLTGFLPDVGRKLRKIPVKNPRVLYNHFFLMSLSR